MAKQAHLGEEIDHTIQLPLMRGRMWAQNTLTIDTGSERLKQCLAIASEVTCYLND